MTNNFKEKYCLSCHPKMNSINIFYIFLSKMFSRHTHRITGRHKIKPLALITEYISWTYLDFKNIELQHILVVAL